MYDIDEISFLHLLKIYYHFGEILSENLWNFNRHHILKGENKKKTEVKCEKKSNDVILVQYRIKYNSLEKVISVI